MLKNYKRSKWNRRHGGKTTAMAKVENSPEYNAIVGMFNEQNVKKLLGLLMIDAQKAKPTITIEEARTVAMNKLKPFYDAFKEPPNKDFNGQIKSIDVPQGMAYRFSEERPIDLLKIANELNF